MKIRIARTELGRVLGMVKKAVGRKSSLDALRCVLLDASFGSAQDTAFDAERNAQPERGAVVQVTATDLEFALQTLAGAVVIENGVVAVPFERLVSLLPKMTAEEIELESDADGVTVVRDGTGETAPSCKLKGVMADEFPLVTFGEDASHPQGAMVMLTREAVKEIHRVVLPVTSADDARPLLTGAHWCVRALWNDGLPCLYVAAADGYRLAQLRVSEYEGSSLDTLSHVVPTRLLEHLDRADAEEATLFFYPERAEDGTVKSGGYVVGQVGGLWLRAMLLEGNYPDVVQIIGTDARGMKVTVNKGLLVYALGLAGVFGNDVRFDVSPDAKQMRVGMLHPDSEGCQIPLPVECEGLSPLNEEGVFSFALSGKFLREALEGVGGEEVTLEMDSAVSPHRIVERKFRAVIMPLNLEKVRKPEPPAEPDAPTQEAEPPVDLRWRVSKLESGEVVRDGFVSEEAAQGWLEQELDLLSFGEGSALKEDEVYEVSAYKQEPTARAELEGLEIPVEVQAEEETDEPIEENFVASLEETMEAATV